MIGSQLTRAFPTTNVGSSSFRLAFVTVPRPKCFGHNRRGNRMRDARPARDVAPIPLRRCSAALRLLRQERRLSARVPRREVRSGISARTPRRTALLPNVRAQSGKPAEAPPERPQELRSLSMRSTCGHGGSGLAAGARSLSSATPVRTRQRGRSRAPVLAANVGAEARDRRNDPTNRIDDDPGTMPSLQARAISWRWSIPAHCEARRDRAAARLHEVQMPEGRVTHPGAAVN